MHRGEGRALIPPQLSRENTHNGNPETRNFSSRMREELCYQGEHIRRGHLEDRAPGTCFAAHTAICQTGTLAPGMGYSNGFIPQQPGY